MAVGDPTAWMLSTIKASRLALEEGGRQSMNIIHTEATDISFEDDPRFQRLVEGVHYSQRLMVSYHAVIVIIILLFTIKHWTTKIGHARRQTTVFRSNPISTASSNAHTTKPITKPTDESKPLLNSHKTKLPKSGMRQRLKSWMMYQPQPLPIINKDLPSNETSLVVIFLASLEIFYLFMGYQLEVDTIFLFGDRAAALFVGNLPWLYILSAKNQPIKLLTGLSYESLNIIHRRLGEMLCLLAVLHLGAMIGVWYTILYPLNFSFVKYLSEKLVILGICSFVCYQTLYLTSLRSFRNRFYELFLFSHVVLQFAALLLVYFHHPGSRIVVPIAMAIFLADSIVFRKVIKTRTVKATLQIAEDGETVLVSAPVKLEKLPVPSVLNSAIPLSLSYGRKTSQHVFFTIPRLGLQTHPFSVSSSPPTDQEGKDDVQLIIRAQKGFSRDLLEYAKVHDSANVFLDGPYGSLDGLEMMMVKDINVIFAAGSGIAVAYPTCRTLADNLVTSRNNKLQSDRTRKLCLIWVIREQSNLSWIAQENMERLRADGVQVIIPGPSAQYGRPNGAKLLEEAVRSRLGSSNYQSVGVFCSGPDSLNRSIRNATSSLVAEGVDIDLAVEKYGW